MPRAAGCAAGTIRRRAQQVPSLGSGVPRRPRPDLHRRPLPALHVLEEAQARFAAQGVATTGEVGEASPIDAITTVLQREGPGRFDAVILSTLPPGASRWLGLDLPTEVRRHHFGLDVLHVVGHLVDA